MIPQTWDDVIPAMNAWLEPCAEAAMRIRVPALSVPTEGHIGFYYSPVSEKYAVYGHEGSTDDDLERTIKFASEFGPTRKVPLTLDDIDQYPWIKVAYSQTLKTILENLNFIPGKYMGMIPNHPNPLAATLTSGLAGAGLGYGVGRAAKAVLPEGYGENLPTSLALLGGAGGAGTAGLLRAYPSVSLGKPLTSNWPFSDIGEAVGTEAPTPSSGGWDPGKTIEGLQGPIQLPPEPKSAPPKFKFKETRGSDLRYKYAQFDTFAPSIPMPAAPTPFDIHVNALGQTLWQSGASPQLTSGAMATMYAASQMPSERAMPGYVTADQLGKLALNAAGNYGTGFLAGYAINKVIGTPYSAPQFGMGNVALGVIGSVIPKIFGQ
jgi:hypothetical protein